jgi:hypothetical protein
MIKKRGGCRAGVGAIGGGMGGGGRRGERRRRTGGWRPRGMAVERGILMMLWPSGNIP